MTRIVDLLTSRIRPISLLALNIALLAFFLWRIPIHRMYGVADSGEYQRMALFIAGQGSLAEGYSQNFVPGLPTVVAIFYAAIGNIDYSSLIANLLFSSGALLVFLKLSGSLKLSVTLMFIPYWIIASFSTLADVSFIFLELAAVYLLLNEEQTLSLFVASVSTVFRIEGIVLVLVLLAAIARKKQFRREFLLFLFPGPCLILLWGLFAFGNPLITFNLHIGYETFAGEKALEVYVSKNVTVLLAMLSKDLSLGLTGVAKVGYVILAIVASIVTIYAAHRKFGSYHVFFLAALAFTLVHTVLFPGAIFPDMTRFYLYVAPFTLILFQKPIEKWFVPVLLVLAPIAVFIAYVFWTVTFSVPLI